ncbi:MAG: PAS domain S-box protein [Bacteroidota bacterium]|nr:PAS domain S-box protein [Bacteroidota bacterium]
MPTDYSSQLSNYSFLAGGGEMGELIRSFNWNESGIGNPASWPVALQQSVSMLMNTSFPILICWGDEYIQIYNDAFRPINGATKHPHALGASASDTYAEIWDTISPMFQKVMSGSSIGFADFLVKLNRNGYFEDCYFDFSYSPIYTDDGKVGGIRVICVETTAKIKAQQKLDAVNQELASTNKELASANEELAATNEELTATNEELLRTQGLLNQTLANLSESESRFRNLIKDASVGVVLLIGEEFRVDIVNEAYGRLIRRTASELEGRLLFEVIPDAEDFFRPLIEGVLKTGEPVYLYATPYMVYNDGEPISGYIDVVYQPYRENDGHISGVLVLCQDVSAQVESTMRLQKANEELSAKETRLQMAIAATDLGIWEYHISTGDLYWSPECRRIYGISLGDSPTMALFADHIHPEDRDYVQNEIDQCIATGSSGKYNIIYRILRFDNGEIRWIKVQGNVYDDVEGKPQRFIGTVLDISELKQAEEESAKLAAIITSSDDAIISKTLESVITSWNYAAERIFGYTAEDMIGESVYKLIPVDRHDEETTILERLRKGERVEHFETKRASRDGRLIDVSLTISPIKDNKGNVIGASKIARDITERKLDERRKNDFIGMVSHELKTPLTSLNAILQVAAVKLRQHDDRFLTNAMDRANIQVKKMTAMINGFLNVSRLESGKIIIDRQQFDIYGLIDEIVTEARLTIGSHDISLHKCDGIMVNADRDKIASVIVNFINNAVKYSPKGHFVEVICERMPDHIIVSVRDEGMGIPKKDLPYVFDRYFRSENENTHHISGFGIGLYLSAEIVKQHSGEIWAESIVGTGSTFYFSLPIEITEAISN